MTLEGKRVLLTRFEEDNDFLKDSILREGAIPVSCPLIKISYNDVKLNGSGYTWMIFTSQHAVHAFFKENQIDKYVKIAVIGEKTKKIVEAYGYYVSFVPSQYHAESFIEEIKTYLKKEDRILFLKGNLAKETISQLRKEYSLEELVVYETVFDDEGIQLFQENIHQVDAVIFTSPSMVHAVSKHLIDIPIFVIGPTTKKALVERGYTQVYMPKKYTFDELLEELKRRL